MEIIARNGVAKSQILAAIREAGIEIRNEGYTHRIMNTWKAVSDGSLSAGGFELVSPPMKGAKNIEKQIKLIHSLVIAIIQLNLFIISLLLHLLK